MKLRGKIQLSHLCNMRQDSYSPSPGFSSTETKPYRQKGVLFSLVVFFYLSVVSYSYSEILGITQRHPNHFHKRCIKAVTSWAHCLTEYLLTARLNDANILATTRKRQRSPTAKYFQWVSESWLLSEQGRCTELLRLPRHKQFADLETCILKSRYKMRHKDTRY